jgi:hypothetical protein
VGDDPAGSAEPEGLGLAVELPPEESRLRSRRSSGRIDPHALHRRKIDDDPSIAHRSAGDVVAAATDRDEEIALAREPDDGLDIGDAGTARDERGMPIDRAVPDAACGVVLRVVGTDQLATKVACQVGEGRIVERGGGATFSLKR